MFKFTSFAATMLLLLPLALAEPPRMDTLKINRSEAGLTVGCTLEKLCVETDSEDLSLKLAGSPPDPVHMSFPLTGLPSAGEESSIQLWAQLIRFKGGILAGLQTQARAMYSGGAADSTTLHLIAFLPGQPPFEVLSVPQSANATIRACFSERDIKRRAEACQDEYSFNASLALTGKNVAEMPELRYHSQATSFPGPVSRSKDSLAGRPLRKRDLVTVTDTKCSYQRLYRFAAAERRYVPNAPPPDCSNYTEP
ncbi:MAG: hypothetical protein K2Y28_00820 [Burkholderiaceae bacterium]|nr:hypothetical protein [Burkholderiaceae bacterium]